MNERQLEDLIQRDLDGELSPSERAEMEAALATDPEARRLREEMGEMASLVAGLTEVEPPAELGQRIRRSLADRPLPASRPARARVLPWRGLFAPPRARFAYLAAGLFIGALGVRLLTGGLAPAPQLDPSDLAGSINLPRHDGVAFDVPGGRGELRIARGDRGLTAQLVTTGPELDWTLSLDGLRLAGLEASGTRITRLANRPGELALGHAGRGSLRLDLELAGAAAGELEVEVLSGGVKILETLIGLDESSDSKASTNFSRIPG